MTLGYYNADVSAVIEQGVRDKVYSIIKNQDSICNAPRITQDEALLAIRELRASRQNNIVKNSIGFKR